MRLWRIRLRNWYGIIQLDGYVLIVSGHDGFPFSMVYQRTSLSILQAFSRPHLQNHDVVDVIEVGGESAVVGYGPYKEDVLAHLQPRIRQQNVIIRDISHSTMYTLTEDMRIQGITVSKSYLGGYRFINE